MNAGPDFARMREAHARIAPHIHRTPVFTSASLNRVAGAELYFKCENLQRTGSFKIRGAANAVFSLSAEEAARGVLTHSSGNHAAAVARAAEWRGIPAWIVMPENAPAVKRRAVEAYGGRIRLCAATLEAREAAARELAEGTGATLVHPYDDDRVIAGQGTAAVELLEEVPELDLVAVPVSGGGLLSGTAIAANALRPGIRVVGVEPEQADDARRSLATGQLVRLAQPQTIADGLRASLSEGTLAILRERVEAIATVSEAEIVEAMRMVWERMKLVVEASAAVPVAAALHRRLGAEGGRAGIILSGGNVDLDALPFGPSRQGPL
jgi:threonine dehydratase